ncbi:499ede32-eac5-4845-ad66-83321f2d21a2 [Thermothielavioides terrestris]|uniref:499ede32-eac5-4845-ad66-83321f2d21a2 n=1 Tax=Thermothielavioides terrestris TaxID=2587410 RepID=A0A446BYU2_9PEZI|nr:499ede32-eac5-4845-ad66-83321f2d21a2 [Thermothielavioides terrestris]
MARLNEQPAPAESHLEILRRKFLRQNRDIAKINSDQSQKIRRLENDCARLLSENLELRGQILRLEKQLEDNSARRIADHALEVKAKLELQLSEFAALLGTLGVEPPSKRRSSGERTLAKPRPSVATSPPRRRRRDTTVDAETLAEQEGRLPPIYENKTYPRATMNEEILALCAAAADTSDSPDLGPPPVSRFVDEDAVQHDSPAQADVPDSPKPSLPLPPLSPLNYDRVPSRSPEPNHARKKEVPHDTPPPADISSTGETSRPSRRARAPISYAEPNLRDKMRRPTKQLFDAVTGEGKFVHRVMAAKLDDRHTAPTSVGKVKAEPGSAASRSSKTSSAADPTVEAQQRALVSPLAQKDGFSETLPSTVVTERRKRPSAVGSSRESLVALNRSDGTTVTSPTTNAQPGNCQQSAGSSMTEASLGHDRKQQSAPGPSAEVDIYDFSASSPAPSTTKEPSQAGSEPAKPAAAAHSSSSSSVQPSRTRTARKSSMAAAAALRTLLDEEAEDAKSSSPPPRPRSAAAHARKRASMLAPKKSSMLDALEDAAEDVANTSGSSAASHEGDAVAKDRISRRRSMML